MQAHRKTFQSDLQALAMVIALCLCEGTGCGCSFTVSFALLQRCAAVRVDAQRGGEGGRPPLAMLRRSVVVL
eukprot:6187709-Pleurochrysis_carterae.AAC.3